MALQNGEVGSEFHAEFAQAYQRHDICLFVLPPH
jgi:hypothetical protein